ncbi:MAG: thioredoxin [Ignavibacteriae bacterium]|nr:thioredoxin [Ignavibacteriota bacterium]
MVFDVVDFQKDVIERSSTTPVLVDFWAEWCGPCKILGPVLEKLAAQANGNWQLAKLDTERFTDVAARYNIRNIPNVKLFVDGKVETEFVGALPEPMLKQWLEKNIPSKFRKDVQRAEAFLDSGKTAEAQQLLSGVVAAEPGNKEARALLARLLVYTDQARALDLVKDIQEDSSSFESADAIRTLASLLQRNELPAGEARDRYAAAIAKLRAQEYAAALEGFIDVIRSDRYYDDDGSRRACIAIFKFLGEEHEVTRQYRREFSRALY